jgi:single-strand DNA-binding protein
MLNVNRVTLLGHVGRDPEFHSNAAGDRAARFSLATTERWKNRDGEPQERTEWHRIIVFGGAVGVVERLVRKGTAVLVEGRLTVREYTDREDAPRQATEIIVGGPQGMVNVLAPGAGREPEDPVAPAAPAGPNAGRSDWA